MLEPVAADLWTASVPHSFAIFEFGARMSVVRLRGGELLVFSPLPLSPELKAEVEGLGPLRHIVAPNLFHHLYAGHWAAAFPEARLYAAPGLAQKRADLRVDEVLGPVAPVAWAADLRLHAVQGMGRMQEHCLFHPSSGTLLGCDLVSNFPRTGSWITDTYSLLMGFREKVAVPPAVRFTFDDKARARPSVEAIFAEPIERVLIAHGPPISGPETVQRMRKAYEFLG
jgi:hypothetical protein